MRKTEYGFSPTHPGEVLKDEIEYRGITQGKIAAQMGMSYKMLNDILNCRRPLTATTAMLFEAVLDIPADSLMNLQLKYNMQIVRKDKKFAERLAQIRKTASML
ncbi:MAG TPA: HigA family addiction module antidote protein [Petrimonas sp.]|uniref:HTH cro/C1-type domain-containing protein n=1 Tax=bioreactor metagenome TaxID=1076179 RepID=A0A644ZQX5_9ZZZZ|nr:HigA family addiction module antitoxin [Petrimonas sp.]OJV36846.1 MAG: addiction module antidote protein, HigA family [Bacteroidia bacterium 43-41]MEA4950825.1 HigA family addiction module antitoxin [Petrimonas sp.]MEA4978881.1 HigA family addiction module antitoxin [Petrimonas sp.]MEA5063263.1 HigA family addiction module antitoxin [Petrimonas sp.]